MGTPRHKRSNCFTLRQGAQRDPLTFVITSPPKYALASDIKFLRISDDTFEIGVNKLWGQGMSTMYWTTVSIFVHTHLFARKYVDRIGSMVLRRRDLHCKGDRNVSLGPRCAGCGVMAGQSEAISCSVEDKQAD